jgi:hypothetical protein
LDVSDIIILFKNQTYKSDVQIPSDVTSKPKYSRHFKGLAFKELSTAGQHCTSRHCTYRGARLLQAHILLLLLLFLK